MVSYSHVKEKKKKKNAKRKWPLALQGSNKVAFGGVREGRHGGFCGTTLVTEEHLCTCSLACAYMNLKQKAISI